MEITFILEIFLLGIIAGFLSGALGIGGGIVIIPALIFIYGFSVHQAQGTLLAFMVPPIGLPAFISYYRRKQVNLRAAYFLMFAFLIASFLGSEIALKLPENIIRKGFGAMIIFVGIKMFFSKKKNILIKK